MSDKKHLKAIISGKVQGVFFRAFVMKKARELDVCGQVKFLENGSLEVQAEAKENKLKEFDFLDKIF